MRVLPGAVPSGNLTTSGPSRPVRSGSATTSQQSVGGGLVAGAAGAGVTAAVGVTAPTGAGVAVGVWVGAGAAADVDAGGVAVLGFGGSLRRQDHDMPATGSSSMTIIARTRRLMRRR